MSTQTSETIPGGMKKDGLQVLQHQFELRAETYVAALVMRPDFTPAAFDRVITQAFGMAERMEAALDISRQDRFAPLGVDSLNAPASDPAGQEFADDHGEPHELAQMAWSGGPSDPDGPEDPDDDDGPDFPDFDFEDEDEDVDLDEEAMLYSFMLLMDRHTGGWLADPQTGAVVQDMLDARIFAEREADEVMAQDAMLVPVRAADLGFTLDKIRDPRGASLRPPEMAA